MISKNLRTKDELFCFYRKKHLTIRLYCAKIYIMIRCPKSCVEFIKKCALEKMEGNYENDRQNNEDVI